MQWTDIYDIVISLEDLYPEYDIININFTDLRKIIILLNDFKDDPEKCNERILEAIQGEWIKERG